MALTFNNGIYTNQRSTGGSEVIKPVSSFFTVPSAAANYALLTAVANKFIKVVSVILGNLTANAGYVVLRSNTTALTLINFPGNAVWPAPRLEDKENGIAETNLGEGLFCDNGATSGVLYLTIQTITYTP